MGANVIEVIDDIDLLELDIDIVDEISALIKDRLLKITTEERVGIFYVGEIFQQEKENAFESTMRHIVEVLEPYLPPSKAVQRRLLHDLSSQLDIRMQYNNEHYWALLPHTFEKGEKAISAITKMAMSSLKLKKFL